MNHELEICTSLSDLSVEGGGPFAWAVACGAWISSRRNVELGTAVGRESRTMEQYLATVGISECWVSKNLRMVVLLGFIDASFRTQRRIDGRESDVVVDTTLEMEACLDFHTADAHTQVVE